jgi:pyruvate-formate lyase-activating enzyme
MAQTKKLFCAKPFRWFDVAPGEGIGDVYMCCPKWLDLPIGNLLRQSVEEIWNGETAQEIRASILDGSFRYCDKSRCPSFQAVVYPVQYVEDVTDEELKAVIADGLTVLPYGPRDINCSYDLSCNLSCPSCRTQLFIESTNREKIEAIRERLDSEALQNVEWLCITGSGDPFGSPFFRRWLRNMERERMPRLKGIHLHTNGLLWTPEMWNSIPAEIREMIVSTHISIDAATPETYALNRRGGSFDTLLENLEYVTSLRANGPLQTLCISMVVQANNFEEMPEFLDLGRRIQTDKVYYSKLINWGTFSEGEFLDRAVHLPGHPRHAEFLDLIGGDLFDDELVELGNIIELRRPRTAHRAE